MRNVARDLPTKTLLFNQGMSMEILPGNWDMSPGTNSKSVSGQSVDEHVHLEK